MEEKRQMEEAREASGLDSQTFSIYWILEKAGTENSKSLATEIKGSIRPDSETTIPTPTN
jgi:hypothetical protein